jgi:predicted glutamine amidotransferase
MGHTRWPTGSAPTTDKNAHPFAAGDLIGAHNGSLKGVEFYDKTLTDSELMIRTMAKEGIVPVLERLSVWDAYAVTIWDKTKKLLTVARNKERDLTFAVHKNKGVMFWASEDRYLDFVFSKYYKDDEFTYYDVTPYHVFTIDPKNVKGGHIPWITEKLTPKVRPKPEMKKVVGGTSTSTTLQKNQEYYEELYGLGSWDAVLINKGMNDEIPF